MRILAELRSDIAAKRSLYSQYGDNPSVARILVSDGTLANVLYRIQAMLVRWKLAPLALLPHWFNKWLNGCVIGIGARFGPGLVLVHPIGVVINSAVRGGQNIRIESGVVLGDNRGAVPVLGDDIFIGSGAKVIGAVELGNGARVGANAVVLRNVPAGVTVVGVPARPVQKEMAS